MFGIHSFTLFLTTGILLNLMPGPDTAYIIGRSIAQGRRAGIASALGITLGSVCHTIAAALGLSAFLAASAFAFTTVKLIGGAYLIYLGVRMILSRARELHVPSHFRSRRNGGRLSSGYHHEFAQSESRTLLSRVSAAVHRSGIADENSSVHRARFNICHDGNNLVFDSRLVCRRVQ